MDNQITSAAWTALCAAENTGACTSVIRARLYDLQGFTTNAMNMLHAQESNRDCLKLYCQIKRRVEPYDVSIME